MMEIAIGEALEQRYKELEEEAKASPAVEENTNDVVQEKPEQEEREKPEKELNDDKPEEETGDEQKSDERNQKKPPKYIVGEYVKSYDSWPEEAKKYIARREADIEKGFSKHDELREYGKRTQNTFKQYDSYLQELGVRDALEVIDPLLQHDRILRRGSPQQKVETVKNLLQEYNIDVNWLTTEPQQVPQHAAYNSELHTLQQQIAELKQAQERQKIEPFEQIEREFAEKNPLMRDPKVYQTVGYIIENNSDEYAGKQPQEVLSDAMDRALAMLRITNPLQRVATAIPNQDVARAKQMAVSPRGTAGSTAPTKPTPKDWNETLEMAMKGQL